MVTEAVQGPTTIAFLIWNADKWSLLCAPDNHLVTGHAVWHVLTAVAIWCFARQQALPLTVSAGPVPV